ncbi:malto-oligosyltrehalose trehalohydrolase [Oscillatoria sp. FACHB-1407]|uniref:malto-oligosyltrehalose trehalohydrolase n=1 Tax=Oscillatoria sp. FACHB-1407 TaxID=2692847 RepID=UPI0016898FFF|nr:malto-oligosyltrehalose trehalohydrolase [Oscillatoria sp. FACHB-1407]MBD2463311.1 malto-oligosyltrehalose trehalohydrolase [Oscillatoria sp. FACHB-1407]
MKVGSRYLGNNRCEFTVWAPFLKEVAVKVVSPVERLLPMQSIELGYWQVIADDIAPGTRYFYQLDGKSDLPDPASNFQPQDVHGPSEVVDHQTFQWTDQNWSGIPLEDLIIYELHVGTFTPNASFEAIIPRLKELYDFGVNAIEIMPIAQFPGARNWGYDGVYPYAAQHSYGGVEGLKKLVDAAHQQGMSVILDVVYNHFGPEGNYIGNYAPFFTERHRSPWGSAINFDGAHNYGVRNFFIQNALYWFEHYHIDGLRLDATDTIYDLGARHFLQELADRTNEFSQQQGRKFYLIAESDLNDARVVRESVIGGYGIDAQWNDSFHHCVHTLLTGENIGYYIDYGRCEQLAKAFKKTFVYSWDYSVYRNRWHGSDVSDRPGYQFIVCIQNHDQVGNRLLGERLTHLVSFEALKLAAGTLFLSPNVPLLFMGEEYGEEAPFLYFVSHSDPELIAAVRAGRKEEFAAFHIEGEYADPESLETFKRSQLTWEKRNEGKHKVLLEFYQHLIQLRRTIPALKKLDKQNLEASALEDQKLMFLHRWNQDSQIFCVMNFNLQAIALKPSTPPGNWRKILDSSEPKWMGQGTSMPEQLEGQNEVTIQPHSFVLYQQ